MLYLIISFDYEDIYWILEKKKLHNPRVVFVNLFMYELTMIWRQTVRIVHGLHLSGSLVEDGCILVHDKGNMNPPEWTNVYVYSLAINTILAPNVGHEIHGWVGSREFYSFLTCIGLLVLTPLLLARKM